MFRFLLFILLSLLISCSSQSKGSYVPTEGKKRPKNVILMIGDGMGIAQITAGLYSNKNRLQLEKFPIVGLHKSYASNALITDSAAGATAFACGQKTYNGAIAVDPDTIPIPTILELAEAKGLATGLIATSTIVHATPASFIAHVSARSMYEKIAEAFLDTEIDLFIGGGKKFFDRRETDDQNLYELLTEKGYVVSDYFNGEIQDLNINFKKNFAYFTADNDPLPVLRGRNYLEFSSELAPIFLKNHNDNQGFFLMIEGSQIDWGGHANNSEYIVSEVLDFDKAIGKVLNFAKADGETLVIVTADHETGGYAINPGSTHGTIVGGFTSDYHTAALIPVFAFGPGSELFKGIYENTAINHKMKALLGL